MIESAIASVGPAADAKGVQLVQTVGASAGQVRGDANRLQQVIWNLLSNAVKFTPRGGKIEIVLRQEGPNLAVIVSDNGIGIERVIFSSTSSSASARRTHRQRESTAALGSD